MEEFSAKINEANESWVKATARISPKLLARSLRVDRGTILRLLANSGSNGDGWCSEFGPGQILLLCGWIPQESTPRDGYSSTTDPRHG